AATLVAPTPRSMTHSTAVGAIRWRDAGTPVNSAPAMQKAKKISHAPSVLRTSRMVATAAPDSTDERMPTSCHGPSATAPGGALGWGGEEAHRHARRGDGERAERPEPDALAEKEPGPQRREHRRRVVEERRHADGEVLDGEEVAEHRSAAEGAAPEQAAPVAR